MLFKTPEKSFPLAASLAIGVTSGPQSCRFLDQYTEEEKRGEEKRSFRVGFPGVSVLTCFLSFGPQTSCSRRGRQKYPPTHQIMFPFRQNTQRKTSKSSTVAKLCFLIQLLAELHLVLGSWDEWWTYDGISGPDFWGLLNPEWHLCNKGRRQSPIDIKPGLLLYDPNMRPLHIDKHRVSGILENNGHSIVFRVKEDNEPKSSDLSDVSDVVSGSAPNNDVSPAKPLLSINISGGPLSYSYTFHSIYLHFGRTDRSGSEHHIGQSPFPAELQIIGYNSDLYQNVSEASNKANGLVAISLLMQLGNSSNNELRALTSRVNDIKYRGQNITIKSLSIRELVPDVDYYMTYEGSLTLPGCQETATWIIINKPVFITKQQLYALRKLMQGESEAPKAPLGNNFRPIQPLNHRFVRTNIDFKRKQNTDCPTMKKNMQYQVNSKHSSRV